MGRLGCALALLASQALADAPLSGPEFDAYVTGRTLTFGLPNDQTFGVEQYLPDRRVIWSPRPGECIDGIWFEDDGDICFLYENDPEPKCWRVYQSPRGIRAEFTTRPDTTILFEALDNPEPLICSNLFS